MVKLKIMFTFYSQTHFLDYLIVFQTKNKAVNRNKFTTEKHIPVNKMTSADRLNIAIQS
jgi:hypothetical protein